MSTYVATVSVLGSRGGAVSVTTSYQQRILVHNRVPDADLARQLITGSTFAATISVNGLRGTAVSIWLDGYFPIDSLDTTDVVTRNGMFRRFATEELETVDFAAAAKPSAVDFLHISDVAVAFVRPPTFATDHLTITEVTTRAFPGRRASESLTVAEVVTRIGGFQRTASFTVLLFELIDRKLVLFRTATESISTSDVAGVPIVTPRTASDTLVVTDVATRIVGKHVTTTDALLITHSVARSIGKTRTAVDVLFINDVVTAARHRFFVRTALDALGVSMSITAFKGLVASSDALRVTQDVVTRVLALVRKVFDHPVITEQIKPPVVRTASDALAISDIARKSGVPHPRSASEFLSVTETLTSATFSRNRTATESLSVSLSATRKVVLNRIMAPPLTLLATDSTTTLPPGKHREATDALSVSELVTLGHAFTATELLQVTDQASVIKTSGIWVYLLPFPTGNSPVESRLMVEIAESALTVEVAHSVLWTERAGSELTTEVAGGSFAAERASSELVLEISGLINPLAGSTLDYQ